MRKLLVLCVFVIAPCTSMAAGNPDAAARALFDAEWQWRMQNRPELATAAGDHRYNATLSDTSLAGSRAATAHAQQMLEQALQLEHDKLSPQNQLSLELFVYEQAQKLEAASFYPYQVQPLSGHEGIHISFAQLVAQMPFAHETDYRNYLARIEALPAHIDGIIEQLGEGLKTGWSTPRAVLRPVPELLRQLREGVESGALGLPFRQIPATIPKAVRDELAAAGPAALRARAAPALQRLEQYLRADYLPLSRESIGANALPGGNDYYAFLARVHSTADLTPSEIHALGLQEVARIRAGMRAAIARTGFAGNFAQFVRFATTDPRLFYKEPAPLLARYRSVVARASARLPELFAALPSEALVVKPVQALGAETQSPAYYQAGSLFTPAALVVNTSRLAARPIWEIETLALHEGVPGHHLQTARAHELADLPEFRRRGWYVAFGEGWALYAESLGPELGLMRDPFSRFGQLNSELFRAARLVVDTGIHARGWTRQQALDYLNANTANTAFDNEVEVDRYIGWPGQALGYKLGQLRIRALREQAQATLGARFDLRRFHGAVIDNGPLPLSLLEQQVGLWMASVAPPRPPPPAAPPAAPPALGGAR
ncbi:DUF885 domain-containing protein [Massilia glaciei]|nr:DUF885 domain-containing protein [Massilia glaciei]